MTICKCDTCEETKKKYPQNSIVWSCEKCSYTGSSLCHDCYDGSYYVPKEIKKEEKDEHYKEHYREDSIISQKKEKINEMINAHWNYMEKVMTVGQKKDQTFTFDEVMQIRKWDYTSSAKHFYGHGYEDAVNDSKK